MDTESKSQGIPILLNLIAAVLGATAQYLYKVGTARLGTEPLYRNWQLFTGMLTFCVITVLFAVAFKLGGKISVTYLTYATTFIWGSLIAWYFGKESLGVMQICGVCVIVLGVLLVAVGSR